MKVKNPFITTGYAGSDYFCDREQEAQTMVDALENGRNITLLAPRRMGKTGLILNSFERLQARGYKTIYVDAFPAQNLQEFTQIFAGAVFNGLESGLERALQSAKEFLKSCRPTITIDPSDGKPVFSFEVAQSQAEATLADVFGYLKSRKERVVVGIDEFQQIALFPEKGVEATLRSHIQFTPGVGFVFAGSRQHLMREMFMSSKRPFYQSTQRMNLGVIDEAAYYEFASRHFGLAKMTLKKDVFRWIYDRVDGITWYMQVMLNRIYALGEAEPTIDDALKVEKQIIGENGYDYRSLVETLPEGSVRLLRAMAHSGVVKSPMAGELIAKYGLNAPSSVATALERLEDQEFVSESEAGYVVYDRFFARWLSAE